MKRRTFLKYCGVTVLAATIPMEVLEAARKDIGIIPLEELEAYLAKYPAIIAVDSSCNEGLHCSYPSKADLIKVTGKPISSDSGDEGFYLLDATTLNPNENDSLRMVNYTSFLERTYGINWGCYAL